jgi:hypothetical protein
VSVVCGVVVCVLQKFKKFTHAEMVSSGVLVKLNMALDASKQKYLQYLRYDFTQVGPGRFEVGLRLKKVVELKVLDKPMLFVLDDLLTMQEQGKLTIDVDDVTLNVNLLIHLLNKHFVAGK